MEKYFANFAILILFLSFAIPMVQQKENWPLSHFPLFARTLYSERQCQNIGFYGVKEGTGEEVYLNREVYILNWLDTYRTLRIMKKYFSTDAPRSVLFSQAAFKHYQKTRTPEEPDFSSLRVYHMIWDPYAGKLDRLAPDKKKLLFEVAE